MMYDTHTYSGKFRVAGNWTIMLNSLKPNNFYLSSCYLNAKREPFGIKLINGVNVTE